MNGQPSLARLLESFFHRHLTQQRNATPATIKTYRDALRLLVLFTAERSGKKPCALTVQDLDRDVVLAYLDPPGALAGQLRPHAQRTSNRYTEVPAAQT